MTLQQSEELAAVEEVDQSRREEEEEEQQPDDQNAAAPTTSSTSKKNLSKNLWGLGCGPCASRGNHAEEDGENNNVAIINDQCRITCCAYPNGLAWVLPIQLVLWMAVFCSMAAMCDCQFVTAVLRNDTDYSHEIPEFLLPVDETSRRGFGFYYFEHPTDGSCYWVDVDRYDGDDLDQYFVFMGREWLAPRAVASLATGIAILLSLWMCVWSCVAHVRVFRIIVWIIIWLILVPFQISSLAVLNSEFCDTFDCQLSRSAWLMLLAFFGFVAAGVCMCFTHSYRRNDNKTGGLTQPSSFRNGADDNDDDDDNVDVELMVMAAASGQSTELFATDLHNGIGDAREIRAVDLSLVGGTAPMAVAVPADSVPTVLSSGTANSNEEATHKVAVVLEDTSHIAVPIVEAKELVE